MINPRLIRVSLLASLTLTASAFAAESAKPAQPAGGGGNQGAAPAPRRATPPHTSPRTNPQQPARNDPPRTEGAGAPPRNDDRNPPRRGNESNPPNTPPRSENPSPGAPRNPGVPGPSGTVNPNPNPPANNNTNPRTNASAGTAVPRDNAPALGTPAERAAAFNRHRSNRRDDGTIVVLPWYDYADYYSPWGSGTWYDRPAGNRSGRDYDNYGYHNDPRGRDGGGPVAADNAPPAAPAVPPLRPESPGQESARALSQLEASPDYRRAVAELSDAQAAYDSAERKVIERLKSDANYRALAERKNQAAGEVEAVQAAARIPSPGQITPAAQEKLEIAGKLTRMEQDAVDASPQASGAKERLGRANAVVTSMRRAAQGIADVPPPPEAGPRPSNRP